MLRRGSRFVLDSNLVISAVKSGWTRSTDLLFTILLSDAEIFANDELIMEYEKYIHKTLGLCDLFLLMQIKAHLINPSRESLETCKPFLPEKQFADIVHAATCLETGSILITNDAHFDRIRDSGTIQVWSITRAIKEVL